MLGLNPTVKFLTSAIPSTGFPAVWQIIFQAELSRFRSLRFNFASPHAVKLAAAFHCHAKFLCSSIPPARCIHRRLVILQVSSSWRRTFRFSFASHLAVKLVAAFHCCVKFFSSSNPPVVLPAVRLAPCRLPRKGFELCVSISRRAGFALNGKLNEELAPAAPSKLSRKVLAAGIEPASRGTSIGASTCVAR
jgi:hypothetical protein